MTQNKRYVIHKEIKLHTKPLVTAVVKRGFSKRKQSSFMFLTL